jgi:hypothetical protein
MNAAKGHSHEPHPLFYFISFIGIYYPLADIVIVHIVYINETIPPPPPLCDAVGGAFYYLVLRMQNPCRRQAIIITLGANATTCRRQAIYILASILCEAHAHT